ncbi:MAG: bifunctional UDP-3-O-[3-hydroxymyristoyl] N-acetylglucosamine deacetylase/3-hydroxyacyl-ACP dehydratase [Paludibacteraceae bacterium]|jgi:UDP-3-O-[3-hydroxymyristoyl] N-acetylglucosamine deacetylase/3-hydroxyacyl-[acyl-carrier-protein] dehydratase|nr:bifunctional UDP-3-O-[3-hydroxymyristoyl] N-acetylglucosamine deacetylase/3-hydroxyacyl-ACP dehydratase [Paludibacteraceae bacterium]
MANQRTIKESFTLRSKGLHTGMDITLKVCPAPENTGIVFKRTDLEGEPTVPALAECVSGTTRGTVVTRGEATVSTIEHAMSALYAYGINNAILEVDAPELPILDGSARYYAENIEKVGIQEQQLPCNPFFVHHRIDYEDKETGTKITILPDDHFSVQVGVEFDSPILPNQYADLNDMQNYRTEIASCRTFVFVREIEPLLKGGYIKGGDLNNAIVIYDQVMNDEDFQHIAKVTGHENIENKPGILSGDLRFVNEPARHKLLDLIGDLALIGRPIIGRVVATRPGHTSNTAFAKKIRKENRHQDVFAPLYDPDASPICDNKKIKSLLPHRWPFQLVDKILELSKTHVVGLKNVTANESFFLGHFPDEPVMPGVLIIEAMAQTGGILALSNVDDPTTYSTYFTKMSEVRFRNKVVPGDTLIFSLQLLEPIKRGMVHMRCTAFVGEKIVTEADLSAIIIKNKPSSRNDA